MSGEYDNYNQAVQSDPQLSQIEKEAQEQLNTEMSKLSSARNQLNSANKNINKQLKSAVLTNQQYDRREVASAREQIEVQRGMLSGQEQQLKQSMKPIEDERARIERAKNQIKSPEILEAQGYKKKVVNGKITYYKEDTYKDRGKVKTYIEEEYVFNSAGQPLQIIKRDDARSKDSDRRFIYEEEEITFENGLVKRFDEREVVDGAAEYEYREFYDSKGRLDEQKYYDGGKFEKEKEYKYDDKTGSVTIETDTAAAKASRQAAIKQKEQFWDDWNKAYWDAKEQGIEISVDTNKYKTMEAQVKEFNKQYNQGIQAKNDIYEVRIKTSDQPKSQSQSTSYLNQFGDVIKKEIQTTNFYTMDEVTRKQSLSPSYYQQNKNIIQDVLGSKNSNKIAIDMSNINIGVPGVNQGTDTSSIPKMNLRMQQETRGTISAPTQNIFSNDQATQMILGAQRQKEYDEANPIKKFFMKDWAAESQKQRDKFDASGGYDTTALTFEIGSGFIAGAQGAGVLLRALTPNPIKIIKNPIQEVGNQAQIYSNIITSIPNIPSTIAEKANRNPGGLVGEVLFDVATGSIISKSFTAVKNSLRPAKIIEAPAQVRTTLIDDVLQTESFGNFQVESGLLKRTRNDFSFESTGNLQRVKSFDIPDVANPNQLTLTQDTIKLLRDSPETIKFTQTSKELSPFVRTQTRSTGSTLADDVLSKEVFRGEIQTKIKDAKGNIVKVEKQPAELIRSGAEQTLYIDGKPFNIKSEIIDTPKGIGVLELDKKVTGFTQEGAYGLSPKQQTIKTTTTDAAGNQKIALTQKELAKQNPIPGAADLDKQFKQITADQQKLLSNSPFNDVVDNSPRALADPIVQARKPGQKVPKEIDMTKDAQIFKGISMNAQKEAFEVSKTNKNIIEGVITGEKEIPKNLGYEQPKLDYKQTKRLETPGASQERLYREVFGDDFINTAKKNPVDIKDPFENAGGPSFDQTMFFKKQDAKFKSPNDLFKQNNAAAPKPRGASQETIFMEKQATPKMVKPKSINIKDIGLDPAIGVDFAKLNMPKTPPRGFGLFGAAAMKNQIPGMAQNQIPGMDQNFIPGVDMKQQGSFISKQGSGQGFMPGVDLAFAQGMSQGKMMETAQRSAQDLAFDFPTMPPVNIPGISTAPPTGPPKPPKAGSSRTAQKQSSPRKKPSNNGEYIGSLTGALLGLKTKKDLKNLTGLEIRPIKVRGKK